MYAEHYSILKDNTRHQNNLNRLQIVSCKLVKLYLDKVYTKPGTSGNGINVSINTIKGLFVNKAMTMVNTASKIATPILFL